MSRNNNGNKIVAAGQYIHAYFAHLFLKDGSGKDGAGNGSNSHLYL